LKRELGTKFQFNNILGQSPKMLEVLEQLEMIVPTKATVLIQGESGTGKELIARALHENSPRRSGPFVKINCAAMPKR
jgi:transcriptional regulator with PAS, ATPase and Fis domain